MLYLMHDVKQEYRIKKTLIHPKSDFHQREQCKHLIADLETVLPFIYIEESGFQSDDTCSHRYSHKGTRAEATFNWQFKNSCSEFLQQFHHN